MVKFEAPIEEKREAPKKVFEVLENMVIVCGIELPREKEKTDRVPDTFLFEEFSLDAYSLAMLEKIAKCIVLDQPLLLEGEAAAGKSHTIEYLASLCNKEVYRMSLNGQTDVTDLIGKWIPNSQSAKNKIEKILKNPNQCTSSEAQKIISAKKLSLEKFTNLSEDEYQKKFETGGFKGLTKEEAEEICRLEGIEVPEGDWIWQNGEVPRAMESGGWLVLDEVNTCEPQILVRLNSVLEKNGSLVLSEDGSRKINRHPDFRIFATTNPPGDQYRGRVPLSAEWISRWNYQSLPEIPIEIEVNRMLEAEGIPVSKESEASLFLDRQKITKQENLQEYYDIDWIKDLFLKYGEFKKKAKEMVGKGIAKDQRQSFTYDQRDNQRFREYLRVFNSPGNMGEVIREAIDFCFLGKCKNPDDREKLKDVALKLIKVDEPKIKKNIDKNKIEKNNLTKLKGDLLGTPGIPTEHRKKILSS